jgi:large subunit ribosomal protein L31
MKEGIHPTYYPEATVVCACGNTWTTGATEETIRTDVCSACHPFYTGEQRIVDTAGQVERFMRRLEKKVELSEQEES